MHRNTWRRVCACLLGLALLMPTPAAQAVPQLQSEPTEPALDQCRSLEDQGRKAARENQLAAAELAMQAALTCYRSAGDRRAEGIARNVFGLIYYNQERYAQALEQFEAAIVIWHAVDDLAGEATTRANMGRLYGAQGRYPEALEQLDAALAIWRELDDRASEGITLIELGGVYSAQARYAEALEQLETALALARAGNDRRREGSIRNLIGRVYHSQERYAGALEEYAAALAIARELGDRFGEAIAFNNIGGVYDNQGRYAEAQAQYEAALSLRRSMGDRAGEARTLNNIANIQSAQGYYRAALGQYQAALAIERAIGSRDDEGMTLNNMGSDFAALARYAEALDQYLAALAIRRQIGDRAGEGVTLNNIGEVYRKQGRHQEALVQFHSALAIMRELGKPAGEGMVLNNIAAVYDELGQYAPALEQYEAALAIAREFGDRAGEAVTLNNIGQVYAAQGQQEAALAQYRGALSLQRTLGDRDSEGITLFNIGSSYRGQGKLEQALENFNAALAIAKETGNRALEGSSLSSLGAVFERQARYAKALDYYGQSLRTLEAMRAVAGSEQGRAGFIAQYAGIYRRAVALNLQQNLPAEAFLLSEQGRARAFLDSLATGQVELADDAAAGLLAAEQETYAARQAAQDALARAKALDSPDPKLVADLEKQLGDAEAAYARALAAIQVRRDQLSALVPGRSNSVLGVQQVQALLDKDTTLVSYWLLGDTAAAFVLTAHTFEVVELPEAATSNITSTVASLLAWPNKENAHPRPLRNLYKWLVQPLVAHLHTSHVAIVPHQELHYVPFAALTDGEHYFGAEHTLTLLPSASALRFLADNANRAQAADAAPALVFGNPKTDLPGLPSLPAAEEEADAVAALLATPVYTGTAASEMALREVVSGTDILHLAAHGGYDPADPLASLIALAPGGGEDGKLEAREIFGLPLRGSSLVVLSACETSLGQLSRGDEVVGLTRAFFFAGAPTVVSSLWSVNDQATATLMTSFYRRWLRDGMSKAQALQAAQADVRGDPRWASPFYWAAFVLNGDPGQAAPTK